METPSFHAEQQTTEHYRFIIEQLKNTIQKYRDFWNWLLEQGEESTVRHGWGDYSVKAWLEARYKEYHSSEQTVKIDD